MANRVALGIETNDPGNYQTRLNRRELKVAEAVREDQNIEETFEQALIVSNMDNADGTAYTGAAGEELGLHTGKHPFEVHQAAVDSAAVVTPYVSADGLELQPVAAGDDLELSNGTTSRSKAAYTVGSFPDANKKIYFEAKVKIDDISDVSELAMGWRKAEAYQAAVDSYDEMAAWNVGADAAGQIEIHTILNNAATSETDTTESDWTDGAEKTLRVEVSNDGLCRFYIDGASPAVDVTNFSFDSGEVIVPFLFLATETGDPGVSISEWNVGVL